LSRHAANQSSWHSFIACAAEIMPTPTSNTNMNIISFAHFIIFAPFLLSAVRQIKTAKDIGGQGVNKSYVRMIPWLFGCPCFIATAPRPLPGDNFNVGVGIF
jgi:hypothetical protein